MSPKITVVIPTYNRAALLPRAVNSVLAQTYSDFELIVVDDASTDDTPQVVAGFDDPRIRYVRHLRNRHVGAARNTAISIARGEYVAFLDDDDEWLPDALESLAMLMEASPPGVAFVYGWRTWVTEDGCRSETKAATADGDMYEDAIALRVAPLPGCALVRVSALLDVDGFDEGIRGTEDLDMVVRLGMMHYGVRSLSQVVIRHYWDHGHERLSSIESGIDAKTAEYYNLHLSAHAAELKSRPSVRAGIYHRLGLMGQRQGKWAFALASFWKAAVSNPSLSNFLFYVKFVVWHVSPLSHFRDRARSLRDRLKRTSP